MRRFLLSQLPRLFPVLLAVGCATVPERTPPSNMAAIVQADGSLRHGRDRKLSIERRAGSYLAAAEAALPFAVAGQPERGRKIYNHAAAELVAMLGNAGTGRIGKVGMNAGDYRLQFRGFSGCGGWVPQQFDHYILARDVSRSGVRTWITEPGVGGSLVGVRRPAGGRDAREPLLGRFGYRAPVTATLDFPGRHEAVLALHDPEARREVRVGGRRAPLAGDFTAPLASFPHRGEAIVGLLAMIFAERFSAESGLYMLEPYHADRVPVVLVHGLLSTPQMWLDVINEIEGDPGLRGRVQFWVYWYPTGTPITLSALKLREELAVAHRRYGLRNGVVLVGHSMGGLLARLQVSTTGRAIWDATFKSRADKLFARVPEDDALKRSLIFRANPDVRREIFICVPHRGSELALGSIGGIARKLISLPANLVITTEKTLGIPLEMIFGKGRKLPTSIDGLSPRSPTLTAMERLPIEALHHSIIGDRGRGDTPNSSDGTVRYSSSHLDSAESELIVPGPHGSYARPETIAELRRILKLHISGTR